MLCGILGDIWIFFIGIKYVKSVNIRNFLGQEKKVSRSIFRFTKAKKTTSVSKTGTLKKEFSENWRFFFIKLISFSTCTIITKISDQNFLIKISENSLIISLIEDVQMEIQIKVTNLIPWFFKKWENWKKTRLSFFSFSKKISPVTIYIPAILPHYLTLPIFPLTG